MSRRQTGLRVPPQFHLWFDIYFCADDQFFFTDLRRQRYVGGDYRYQSDRGNGGEFWWYSCPEFHGKFSHSNHGHRWQWLKWSDQCHDAKRVWRVPHLVSPLFNIIFYANDQFFFTDLRGSGTSVVITGTNLTGATAVSFGGTAAQSFTVNSATQITAIVGSGSSGSN